MGAQRDTLCGITKACVASSSIPAICSCAFLMQQKRWYSISEHIWGQQRNALHLHLSRREMHSQNLCAPVICDQTYTCTIPGSVHADHRAAAATPQVPLETIVFAANTAAPLSCETDAYRHTPWHPIRTYNMLNGCQPYGAPASAHLAAFAIGVAA
jgi:hypothetical protein